MFFDSVPSLWFSLSLPAIVLLYLFKRKYVDTPVSSHLLWNRVLKDMEANRPWQKLRNRLLMFVQLLMAALLVLALMQPWIAAGGSAKEHAVIVLDRSASMTSTIVSADGRTESRLDRAKAAIMDWAAGDASGSAITLIAMGEQAEVLLSRETDRNQVRAALDAVTPAYGKTVYKEAMSLASALTRDGKEAEIRLFTDGLFAEPVTGLTFEVPVTVMKPEDEALAAGGNVSVTQFGVKSSRETGGLATAVASVKNWGQAPAQIDVTVYAGKEMADMRRVTVEPGKQTSVYFEGLAPADWYKLDLGQNDALSADNVSYAFLAGERPKRVLAIGGGNLFLEKALQLAGAEVTKLQPEGADAWIATLKPESAPDVIVLESVPEGALASDAWQKLLAGKPVLYAGSGYEGKPASVPAGSYTIAEHPVTRYLKFQDTHVASVRQPSNALWGKPVVSAGEVPLVYAGTDNGVPRLLIAFSLQQSDLPLRTEFPVFIQNALEWLTASQGGSLGRAVAAERKEIAMSPRSSSAVWIDADSGGTAGEAELTSGRLAAVQTVPDQPGLYRLEEKDEAGQTVQIRWLGVTMDSRESGTAAVELEFKPSSGTAGEAGTDSTEAGAASEAPYWLWRWIIALALVVVVWEWGVYRRGTSV